MKLDMIVAQATSQQWGGFQTVLMLVIVPIATMLATLAALIIRDRKRDVNITNQPVIVAMQKEFANQHEFQKHVDKNEKEFATIDRRIDGLDRTLKAHVDSKLDALKIDAKLETIRAEREVSSKSLHVDVTKLQVDVGKLQIETQTQTAQLERIDNKMDEMRDRLPPKPTP